MAEVKISGLPGASAIGGTETFPVVQGGVTKAATVAQLRAGPAFTGRSLFYADSEQYALLLKYGNASEGCFLGSPSTGGFVLSSEGGASQFTVNTSGNVGVGTASPAVRLHVYGGQTLLQYDVAGLNYLDLNNTDPTDNAGVITRYITRNSANSGITTVDIVKYNTGPFSINNNDVNGSISFGTAGGERVRIDPSGKVGIGTSSPNARLTVVPAAATAQCAVFASSDFSTATNSGHALTFQFRTFGETKVAELVPTVNGWSALGSMALCPDGGNVGVGTSTPAAKLDVNGTLKVSGAVTLTLTDAADDTAAATAGVPVGALYRNGSVVMVRVA